MHQELLPLFPLPLVLFPRTVLPLHIFEERYKEMIREALAAGSEFGIVMARKEGVVNAGCTASIARVLQEYPDGRLDVLAVGQRRFELHELVEGRSFLRGRVRYFDDDDGAPVSLEIKQRVVEGYTNTREVTGQEPVSEPVWNDPQLSFQLAQILTDLDFRQQMLTLRSESERMRQLADYFPVYLVKWRHSEQVRAVAPRNGHARVIGKGN